MAVIGDPKAESNVGEPERALYTIQCEMHARGLRATSNRSKNT